MNLYDKAVFAVFRVMVKRYHLERKIAAIYGREFRLHCEAQWKAWNRENDSRADLWLNRQEGASEFLRWLEGE